MAREILNSGDVEGPMLPSLDVLSKAKVKYLNKQIYIPATDKDPVLAIYELQFQNPYMSAIHECYSPFFVLYGTTEQVTAYQQYCSAAKTATI